MGETKQRSSQQGVHVEGKQEGDVCLPFFSCCSLLDCTIEFLSVSYRAVRKKGYKSKINVSNISVFPQLSLFVIFFLFSSLFFFISFFCVCVWGGSLLPRWSGSFPEPGLLGLNIFRNVIHPPATTLASWFYTWAMGTAIII